MRTSFLAAFALGLFSFGICTAQDPTRLTAHPGQDVNPAWDPASNIIVYMRSKNVTGVPFDVYQVKADGTGEGVAALGPNLGFGLANSLSWVGTTRFLALEERVTFHEYLFFDFSKAPFTRTVSDGNDLAFTNRLSINGGGGGGLIRISRNGSTALIRFSASGGGGLTTVRTGPVSALLAQNASTFGTVHISENPGTDQKYLSGAALSPDGSRFVIAVPRGASSTPHDLFLYTTDQSLPPVNLTNSAVNGITNVAPDISPDGLTIAFSRTNVSAGELADLFTINIDGTGLTQITNSPNFSEGSPSWNPSGTRVAFTGTHLTGHQNAPPALPAGEAPNSNIYVMSVTPGNVLTPKTRLQDPPLVVVQGRDVTLTFVAFTAVSISNKAVISNALAASQQEKARTKTRTSFKYEAIVQRTSDENGQIIANEIRKKTVKRNQLTLKNLNPGTYTTKYRVQILKKKPGKKARVVARTDFSPSAGFQIQ